jgi:hypothetical protein
MVDRALAGLTEATALPLADRVALYHDAHDALRCALAEIDQA